MRSIVGLLDQLMEETNHIISISGPSASGKTTLALQIISTQVHPKNEETCIWIQGSEVFPKKRLTSLLQDNLDQKDYILNNTFIIPPTHVASSFNELEEYLIKLLSQQFPPEVKFIVIDNISHHMRFYLSQQREIRTRLRAINHFFDNCLFPLIMRCKREQIILILIHEVSQDIETGKNRTFYHKLFDRIQSISIDFQGSTRLGTQKVSIQPNKQKNCVISYEITNKGLIIN